ncbi:hypothetical protein VTI28DRAFT_5480 [Corynascus sepedonium]
MSCLWCLVYARARPTRFTTSDGLMTLPLLLVVVVFALFIRQLHPILVALTVSESSGLDANRAFGRYMVRADGFIFAVLCPVPLLSAASALIFWQAALLWEDTGAGHVQFHWIVVVLMTCHRAGSLGGADECTLLSPKEGCELGIGIWPVFSLEPVLSLPIKTRDE